LYFKLIIQTKSHSFGIEPSPASTEGRTEKHIRLVLAFKHMPRNPRTKWEYVGIPSQLKQQIREIVDADHYPEGKWHIIDHFVIEILKQAVITERAKTADSSPRPA
jgi:hypothetical protein